MSDQPSTSSGSSSSSSDSMTEKDFLNIRNKIDNLIYNEFHHIRRDQIKIAMSIHKVPNSLVFIITISLLMKPRDIRSFKEKLEKMIVMETNPKLSKLLLLLLVFKLKYKFFRVTGGCCEFSIFLQ